MTQRDLIRDRMRAQASARLEIAYRQGWRPIEAPSEASVLWDAAEVALSLSAGVIVLMGLMLYIVRSAAG